MFGRSTFGVSQPNTFGFGSGASTSFGQPNQLFGSSSNTFGSASSGFGSASQPIFGSPPQSTAPLFGSSAAPAFGQSTQPSGFGSSLFGSSQQPSGSGGIFGSSASTSFGQQSKPSGFGFPSSSSSGLFGQSTQTQQNAGSMFQPSSSSGLFGNTSTFGGGQVQSGTVNKFVPVTGTDTVQKAGAVQSINTKHYCITCMKEYENKSLEELRWEDYQANRKGQQSSFGAPSQPFGIASTNSTLFGQTENKPVFGQPSSSFGQPTFGLSSQTTTSNIFGKSSSAFGNTSTTNSFAFGGTPSTGIFGSSSASKPFATPSNPPLFGSSQSQQNTFGSNIFGQPNNSASSNLFTKPTQQQGFGIGQSTFQFGSTGQNTNVFQNQKPGNTGFTLFGQPNTSTSAFGQPQQQSSLTPFNNIFSKPNQSMFNQGSSMSFMGVQNSPFTNTSKNIFPSNNNMFTGSSTFSAAPSSFNLQPHQPQQQPISNMQPGGESAEPRPVIQSGDPYGFSPHLGSLAPVKQQGAIYATNPRELQKLLDVPQPIAVVTPTTKRIKVFPPSAKKSHLFDEGADASEINLTLKSSAKRLIIRKDSDTSLNRESSNTSLEINVGDERPEPSLAALISKGPPLLASPIRMRKSTRSDEYSSSGLSTKESTITLTSEKSDATSIENDSEQVLDSPTETIVHLSQSVQSTSQSSATEILVDEPASGDASQKPDISKEPPIDTCGITLTRPEYYTVPPMDKLHEHRLGDGQCLIRGFTIGRVGYGNVSFPELIDIANINLDELVHFRYRELTIYPDDTKKPPQGQGLNRRAQVTLDRVYPKGKVDRKLITDVETLTAINFADTLRDLCDKHGTKFLDYRPETGSWVFMVDHFSKYKYSDSDTDEDDTDELDAQTKQKIESLEKQARLKSDPTAPAVIKMQSAEKEKDLPIDKDLVGQATQEIVTEDDDMVEDSPMQTESATSEGSELIRDTSPMIVDFPTLRPASDALHQVKTRRELYQTTGHKLFLMKATLFEDEEFEPINIEKDNIETIGTKTSKKLLKDFIKSPLPSKKVDDFDRRKPRAFILRNKPCALPMDKSLYNCRNYMDMALFKGRSFKVGWGKGMTLTTVTNGLIDGENTPAIRGRIQILDVTRSIDYDPLLESLPGHLGVILQTSDVKILDGVPFASVKNAKLAMACHQKIAKQSFLKDSGQKRMCYYKEVWDLVSALWSDLPWDSNRREELSGWFQDVIAREIEDIVRKFPKFVMDRIYKEIFICLTGYQLNEACELAMKGSVPNLALLMAQMNLCEETKPILQFQMEQWKTTMALDFIPVDVQKIYMLLSGILIYEYDSKKIRKQINVCESLNWRQCIAIILWYMTSSSDPISKSLQIYKEAYSKHFICMKPFPEYLDEGTDILDLQYYLLLLHCDKSVSLEKVLHPLTHTNYAGDYRLSWLLLQMLTALDVGVLNEERRVAVASSFSSQLESLGLPNWAVFPLLFIKDPIVRKNSIMRTLYRNLDSIPSDITENELVNQLLIPSRWIHDAKSHKTKLLMQHWQHYQHLSYTEMWYEAHKVAIEFIIPDLIINEKFDIVQNILLNLEKGQDNICDWKNQGGLLLTFLKVAHECGKMKIAKHHAMAIQSALLEIITKLPFYPMATSKQIAAVSELSKRCYIFAKILLHVIKPTYKGIITVTSIELDKLIMPSDYIFQSLQCDIFKA